MSFLIQSFSVNFSFSLVRVSSEALRITEGYLISLVHTFQPARLAAAGNRGKRADNRGKIGIQAVGEAPCLFCSLSLGEYCCDILLKYGDNRVSYLAAVPSAWHRIDSLQGTRAGGQGIGSGLGSRGKAARTAPVLARD